MSTDVVTARHKVPEFKLQHRMSLALEGIGWSAQEVADFLDVNRMTVSRWMNGHRKPTKAVLMVWADLTKVPLEWLETGEDPNSQEAPPPGLEPGTCGLTVRRSAN